MLIDQEFNILYASEISLEVLKAQVAKLETINGINRLFLVINLKEQVFDTVASLLAAINDIKESDTIIGLTIELVKGTSKNSNLPLLAKFTYRVVIAPHLTAVSFVAMPSARKIYLKSYQKQFLEVP
ncbi:hypothetical protein [Pseudolactococcus laudensis]|uniref:hypothetical protein n=1 Tax=Pseudolactococcus laudensis TaxID=1494461 RepID=UPI002FC7551A